MATTSPDNIWTPDSGDDYALTVDLAATADTVQDALNGIHDDLDPLAEDTGWISITSGFQPGFTSGGTPGPLQYRIRGGVVYWRGGVTGSLPSGNYTLVCSGLPVETRHNATQPLRGGAGFSAGHAGLYEISSSGNLLFAQQSGSNRAWAAFVTAYPHAN